MSETVACPHCGAANTAAEGGAPFFCVGCKAIVDPRRTIERGNAPPPSARGFEGPGGGRGSAPASDRSAGISSRGAPSPGASTGYVSRYDTSAPPEAIGPGGGPAIAGSIVIGLLLAAGAGVVTGAGLGWVGEHIVRVPIVFPLLIGWLIKRGLALGSGGGTPDRGIVSGLALLLIVASSFAAMRYVEYRSIASRQSGRYEEVYGSSPAVAVADTARSIAKLRALPGGTSGTVTLSDGYIMVLDDEARRLENAKATGKAPHDGYDIELLAATGKTGFLGHVDSVLSDGQRVRLFGKSAAVRLPSGAMIAYWILEFAILLMAAFARVE